MLYRRKILLALIDAFGGSVDKLRLQKMLFLLSQQQERPCYEFVPYKYGGYSFTASRDIHVMHEKRYLREDRRVITLTKKPYISSGLKSQDLIPIAEPEFINEVHLHLTSHIGGTPMSGRKLTVDWKHTAEELYAYYNNTPNTQIAQRFQALALLQRGRTLKETAAIVGVSMRTVQKWLTWYRTGDWTNSPVARAGATESLCAPC